MSLKIWLPLNGSLVNNGIGEYTFATNGSYSWGATGKLGRCFTTENTGTVYTSTAVTLGLDFSISLWARVDAIEAAWDRFFGLRGTDTYNYMGMCYHASSSGSIGFHIYKNNGSNGSASVFDSYSFTGISAGVWNHYTITMKSGTTVSMYLNGVLVKQAACSFSSTQYKDITVGGFDKTGNVSNSSINDFRIYDHCLSLKEIRELAKGLISHYPLNDPYIETTTNLITSNRYYTSSSTGWGAHRAVITDFVCTNEPVPSNVCSKMDVTYDTSLGSGGGFGITVGCGNVRVSPNTTYCYSVYVKASDNLAYTNANFLYRYERSDSAAVMEGGIATNNKREHVGNGWYRYYNTFTTNANTTNINFMFFSYPGKNVTYYVCCPQVEVKDHLTPYVLGARTGDFAYDCSGYRNDLTVYSTIKMESPSPRGTCCCNFNQSGFLYNDSIPVTTTQYTIAMWVKIPSSINAQHFLYGTFDSWTGNGVGAWRDTGGTSYNWIMRSDAESSHGSLGTGTLATDVWCHIAWVWNGTTILFYKNGVLVNSVTYGKGGSCVHKNIVLGNSNYNGRPISETDQSSMSDFRFYSTALSASDIKELYDTPITITQNGVLMTQGEFVEE